MDISTTILAILCAIFASARHVPDVSERIVGGTNATIEEFPYQVAVLAQAVSGQIMRMCGGSIIGKQWVLTAAQCKDSLPDSRILIRSGSTDLFSGGTLHHVAETIIHPKYTPYDHKDHDIAVMKVKEEFVYSNTTKPVNLVPKGKVIKVGTLANITGWGYTETSHFFDNLKQVTIPVASSSRCIKTYNIGSAYFTNNTLCAGSFKGGKDFCYADEGGPLVYRGMQLGVAAWTKACVSGQNPGVYTSVSAFRDWIEEQTGI